MSDVKLILLSNGRLPEAVVVPNTLAVTSKAPGGGVKLVTWNWREAKVRLDSDGLVNEKKSASPPLMSIKDVPLGPTVMVPLTVFVPKTNGPRNVGVAGLSEKSPKSLSRTDGNVPRALTWTGKKPKANKQNPEVKATTQKFTFIRHR